MYNGIPCLFIFFFSSYLPLVSSQYVRFGRVVRHLNKKRCTQDLYPNIELCVFGRNGKEQTTEKKSFLYIYIYISYSMLYVNELNISSMFFFIRLRRYWDVRFVCIQRDDPSVATMLHSSYLCAYIQQDNIVFSSTYKENIKKSFFFDNVRLCNMYYVRSPSLSFSDLAVSKCVAIFYVLIFHFQHYEPICQFRYTHEIAAFKNTCSMLMFP